MAQTGEGSMNADATPADAAAEDHMNEVSAGAGAAED